MQNTKRRAILNGEVVDWKDAKVHISTHSLLYGSGVFEGIRAYMSSDGSQLNVFRLRDHVRRIYRNAQLLYLNPSINEEEFSSKIIELLRINEHRRDVYIRPVIYYGEGGIGIRPTKQKTEYFIFTQELENYFAEKRPLNVCFSHWRRVSSNSIPPSGKFTGSYVNSMLASLDASKAGFDEAIMLTHTGYVSEGAGENIFMVRDGTLITPPFSADILDGITRDTVITIARDMGIEVQERDIAKGEIYGADELFLCGTAAQIAPVGTVDKRKIGTKVPGRITERLMEAFERVVRAEDKRYSHFLSPVYTEVLKEL
jgi:branched-chain amino acid aminotransferase